MFLAEIKWSNRRKKAKNILSNNHEKLTNKWKVFLHKISRFLINHYDYIAIEKLDINSMFKSKISNRNLNRNIYQARWNTFSNMLSYKAAEAGRKIAPVDSKNTSQTCSNCHKLTLKKLTLKQRIFKCSFCSYKENRDINAAKNILKKVKEKLII